MVRNLTRKSSCVNARGIPPATGRKMLTTPPGWTWPPPPPPRLDWPLTLTPPRLDLTPPRLDWPLTLTPPQLDWPLILTPPAGLIFDPDPPPPPAGLTFDPDPPPPRLDLTPPPPQVWTDWKHYLPHPSDAGGNDEQRNFTFSSSFLKLFSLI